MTFGAWLRLGRVSNLPTVWSNVLGAALLSGALPGVGGLLGLILAFSCFYVGGMYLNDAFDRHIDALERPRRPIPSGQVSARAVFVWGYGALLLGALLLVIIAQLHGAHPARAAFAGLVLGGLIVVYDAHHKQNPLSPLLMGACRVMIYVGTAVTVAERLGPAVVYGALVLLCYLIGLTYAAKNEAQNRMARTWPLGFLLVPVGYGLALASAQPLVWPFLVGFGAWLAHALAFLRVGPRRSVPAAVVRLIAGISLLDAVLVASTGAWAWALLAAGACGLTRLFQRYVPGT